MSEEKKVGYVFGFTAVLADGMNFNIQGNFPTGVTEAVMGTELDRLRNVVERQRARNEIPVFEAKIDEYKRRLKSMEFDIAQGEKNPKMDKTHLERLRESVKDLKSEIDKGEKQLQETREKAK